MENDLTIDDVLSIFTKAARTDGYGEGYGTFFNVQRIQKLVDLGGEEAKEKGFVRPEEGEHSMKAFPANHIGDLCKLIINKMVKK